MPPDPVPNSRVVTTRLNLATKVATLVKSVKQPEGLLATEQGEELTMGSTEPRENSSLSIRLFAFSDNIAPALTSVFTTTTLSWIHARPAFVRLMAGPWVAGPHGRFPSSISSRTGIP
jgi:hypothetical protein